MVRFAKIYSDQLDAIRTGSLPDQFAGYRLGRFRFKASFNPESQFIIYGW
jgi:hypothetical protein